MADNTEAKFILNYETYIAETAKLGAAYVPPNPIAQLAAMQANHANILILKQAHQQKEAVEEDKRNTREDLYKLLAPRCSSVINYCKAIGADANDLANLQSFLREIRGKRAVPIQPPAPGAAPPNTVSAAQTSYANREDFFRQFVEKLRTITSFNPTEEPLKTATLDDYLASLGTANSDVINAEADTNTARAALDAALYTGAASALNAVRASKPYILTVFGANHPVYKAIVGLKFNLPKRLR